MDDAERELVRKLLQDGIVAPDEARAVIGFDPAAPDSGVVILEPGTTSFMRGLNGDDRFVAYRSTDDAADAFRRALDAQLNGQLYTSADLSYLDDWPSPADVMRRLEELEPKPDPLDEILEAAGIPTDTRADGSAGKIDDLAARVEPKHEWIDCDACGMPIRESGTGAWGARQWIDRAHSTTCDGRLIPPGRDLRANPTYRHTPRSGYIDHDDIIDDPIKLVDDLQPHSPAHRDFLLRWYGQQTVDQRQVGKITDITDT